ncbi:hypothetical protein [Nocardiopsis sp. NRRL B-16309]|uniref:hypothetical protein n=1 Tax=Nocardiopsis sp. NRRL B-16309 TaxID=1519494 RepID=UPI0012E19AAA|nr:hypothetical protein [Nocardiopsis sp. NRRL B-16309]
MTIGKAVISDDEKWYYTGFRWKPLLETPASPKPKLEESIAAGELQDPLESGAAGKKLVGLIAEHGSVTAAEEAVGFDPAGLVPPRETLRVSVYKDRRAFEKDAKRMIAQGWRIQQQEKDADRTSATPVVNGALLGTLFWGPIGTVVGGAYGASVSKKRGQVQVIWERD